MANFTSSNGQPVRLVLNFDINKTILMRDGGVPVERMLNSLMSECTWGLCAPDVEDNSIVNPQFCEGENSKWKEIGELDMSFSGNPSSTCPSFVDLKCPSYSSRESYRSRHLMTFDDFLEKKTALQKAQKKELKQRFCVSGEGRRLNDHYNKLLSSLEVPLEALKVAKDMDVLHLFQGEKYYGLIPAFFHLIDALAEKAASDSVFEARIIFRTFGSDLDNILEEFNLYCEGRHPAFKPPANRTYDGNTFGYVDRRVRMPHFVAKLKRTGEKNEETFLAHVSTKNDGKAVVVTEGGREIFQETVFGDWFGFSRGGCGGGARTQTAGIVDDYPYWANNKEDCHAGKLFLLDSNGGTGAAGIRQIFFDDNIEREHVHIVDCRDLESVKPVDIDAVWRFPNGNTEGVQHEDVLSEILAMNSDIDPLQWSAMQSLCKVMPYEAITKPDYFTDIVSKVLKL